MQIIKIAISILALAISSAAISEPKGPGKKMFDRFDSDGDGYISFEEFQPPREGMGPRADLDGNGEVTRAEVSEHVTAQAAEMSERANHRFEKMDMNGDGVVTKLEAKEAAFYRMDKDQDGFLSAEELKRPHKRPHGGKRAS